MFASPISPCFRVGRRYRSLESFRQSPWDPKESLPRDYSRLFDLGNFKVTQKRVLAVDAAAARRTEQLKLLEAAAEAASGGAVGSAAFSLPSGKPKASGGGGGGDDDGDADLAGGAVEDEEEEEEAFGLGRTGWVSTGAFVTLHVAAREDDGVAAGAVPTFGRDGAAFTAMAARSAAGDAAPPSLHALHRHENRLTLLNMSVQRAKDPLFLDAGECAQLPCGRLASAPKDTRRLSTAAPRAACLSPIRSPSPAPHRLCTRGGKAGSAPLPMGCGGLQSSRADTMASRGGHNLPRGD